MARIQILELPGEGHPFAVIIDQYLPDRYVLGAGQEVRADRWDGVAEKLGARAVLLFADTIDVERVGDL